MITSLTWIPKGAARTRPVRFELSAAELSRVRALAKYEILPSTTLIDDAHILTFYLNNFRNEEEGLEGGKQEGEGEGSEDEDGAMDAENDDEVDDSELPAELRMNEYDDDEDEDMNGMDDFDGEDDIAVIIFPIKNCNATSYD